MARTPTTQPRCLLVEHEALIGIDLEDSLHEARFDARWVASAQKASEALATAAFDVAVLDVVVRSEPCTPIACELKRRRIPFLVYSGCLRDGSLPEFSDAPWLEKPAETTALATALAGIMTRPDARRLDGAKITPGVPQARSR